MDDEIELKGSAVWTVRDGKVTRAEFLADRDAAVAAAGLSK
jgi:ketosteroid isomerase-like protein